MNEITEGRSYHLNVGLIIGNKVVAAGMESLLQRLDRVDSILFWDSRLPQTWPWSRKWDILIVALEEWHLLEDVEALDVEPLPLVLVLGDNIHEYHAEDLARLPVNGFLSLMDMSVETLDDALCRVSLGDLPLPTSLARQLLASKQAPVYLKHNRAVRLTSRERETLSLLADGMSNKQIARRLSISTHGAKRLVGSILLKTGSPNRTAAVVTAIQIGLV
ncbi:response regulator transcription factor [Sphaerisporangium sp. NPDC005288]|uniref:response regulator transcription factor n=1 Tax=Sphaerisporangium sp. NPDC005288 TaxID=3155114 RepID=UPI0033B06E37